MMKSAQEAINEFVDAIAEHYVSTKSKISGDSESVAEEFVSAIEHDLKSTLRRRLSKLETVRAAEETATIEWSVAAGGGEGQASLEADGLEQTLDVQNRLSGTTELRGPLDSAEMPTMDTGADVSDPGQKPVIRSGKSGHADREVGGRNNGAKAADVPDGYEVLGTLGRGGMGIVYKARHIPLNRLVAVKMIISGEQASEDQLRRFQIEAEAAAHLSHPNIVSVYEVGTYKGLPYFSLEFVDGKSVSDLMRETTLTAEAAARLLIPVARAVHYSHEMGILHRDLKPQNILLTKDGTPKVADFGLAKRIDNEDDEKTREGVVLGTPGYMAPEQARSSDTIGPHTDVYALGSILYYLMTGRPPFAAPTPFETVRQLLQNEPVAPSRLQTELDQDLETICLKSLEKEIPKRYPTAGEFADELQRFVDGEPIVARPITRRERFWKWCKRNPRVATLSAIAASLLLCLLLGGIISAVVINAQKQAETAARAYAEEQSEIAKAQQEFAEDTTRAIFYQTKQFFERRPELDPLRAGMLNGIVTEIEKFHSEQQFYNVNPRLRASADLQLGQLYVEAGAYEKAIKKLVDVEQQFRLLNAEGDLRNAEVSEMHITMALGDAYLGIGELKKAEQLFLKLEQQGNAFFGKRPNLRADIRQQGQAKILRRMASIYIAMGKPDQALRYVLESVKVWREARRDRPDSIIPLEELAGALTILSGTYEKAGETEKMLAAGSESLEIQMKLGERNSDVATLGNIAKNQKMLARQYLLLGEPEKSKSLLDQSTSTFQRLLKTSELRKLHLQAVDAYYWQGVTQALLGEDFSNSFQTAETLQRGLIEKSDTIDTQGMLLKILARSGQVEKAVALADRLAKSPEKMMNCGYAACGYALAAEHLQPDDPGRVELESKAIELTRQLIRHGYHDFESLRKTDLDFSPLRENRAFLQMLDEEEAKVARDKDANA